MQKLMLPLLFQLITSCVFCQFPRVNFDSYSVREGLPEHQTYCVFQDQSGFMWIGGDHGLYKYNGYDFIYYKYLPGCWNCRSLEGVFSIQEDKRGLLWILSESEIAVNLLSNASKFTPKDGEIIFRTIYKNDDPNIQYSIELVENRIGDEDFGMPEFRRGMNMSRSTLFRKLYALTNQSPTEFIRTVR